MDEHPMQARSADNYQYLRRVFCGAIEEGGGKVRLEYIKARIAIDRGMSYRLINQIISTFIEARIFKVYETGEGEKLLTLFSTPVSPEEIVTVQKSADTALIKNTQPKEDAFRFNEALTILENSEKFSGKSIPLEELYKKAEEYGLDKKEVLEQVKKLLRKGELFHPKKDFISRI